MTTKKTKEKIIDLIEKMTVLELAELVEELKEKFNVVPTAAVAVAAPAAGGADGEEEKTTATIILDSAGDKKLQVIKAVKAIMGVDLKTAKGIVDSAPKELKKDIPVEEAEKIKEQLDAAGAIVSLK